MKKILTLLLLLFISFAQGQKTIKKANNFYKNFEFKNAIEYYTKAGEKDITLSQNDMLQMANSYFNLNDYQNAKVWYEKIFKSQLQTLDEATFFKYITSLRANRDYDMSIAAIKEYYKDNNEKLNAIAKQIQVFDSIKSVEVLKSINNLEVNTANSDFGVVKFMNKVVFTSARDTAKIKDNFYKWNNQPYLTLYTGEVNLSNGEINQVTNFFEDQSKPYHIGAATFTKDNKYVYFTRDNIKKNNKTKATKEGIVNLQIIKGTLENGKVVKEELLKFNSEDFSCGQPAVSGDGKSLFFVSDMPGGYGSTDIYMAELFEDGSTNSPINLGATINTVGREMFPFAIDSTLYFSSDTHIGFGGLDVFKSEWNAEKKFTEPINVGNKLNSNMDDFSFSYIKDNKTGFVSSNRSGGKGDDDIYYFEILEIKKTQFLSGLVLVEEKKIPIPEANIKVYNLFNELVKDTISNEKGEYFLELDNANEYVIEFSKSGFSTKKINYKTDEVIGKEEKKDVYLSKFEDLVKEEDGVTKIIVNPIYFDYNKWDITPQAIVELDRVLKVMTDFPQVTIKIESHTDSRGKDSYNLSLSDKRAKSTQEYLISKGISEERIISAIGYGESKLVNKCANNVKCTDEEHAANRRSDFIVLTK